MLKFSIIIPYKDTPGSLFELLNTIPENPDYEVIIVDDNSDSPLCINNLQRENVFKCINYSGKKGAGAARNYGISKARGKWLIFADSDDWFSKDAFKILERYVDSQAGIIYFKPSSAFHFKKNNTATRHRDYENLVEEFLEYGSDWIRYRFHPPWSKMIKRSLFFENEIAFDETIVANDIICSLKLGLSAKLIEVCDQTVYIVRQGRPNSLSLKREEAYFDIRLNNHFRYNSILCEAGLKKRKMGGMSTLRKSLNLGYIKFLKVLIAFINNGQPIFERPSYYIILLSRKYRKLRAKLRRIFDNL